MRTVSTSTIPVLAVLALGVTSACSKADPTGQAPAGEAAKAAPGAPAPARAGENEAAAVSHVIVAYNAIVGDAGQMIDQYLSEMQHQAPTPETVKDRRPRSHVFIHAERTAKEALAKARAAHATSPVVADAEALLARASELAQLSSEVGRYYGAETWKDDKGEGAIKLHERFMAGVGAYQAASRKVADFLEARENAALEKELAEHDPSTPSHHVRKMLLEGKRLLRALQTQDPDTFVTANERFQKAATELDAFCKSKPDAIPAFKALCRNVLDNLAPRAIKLARSLKDPTARPSQVASDRDTMVSFYNNLVQVANSLFQLEAQGVLK